MRGKKTKIIIRFLANKSRKAAEAEWDGDTWVGSLVGIVIVDVYGAHGNADGDRISL